LQNYNSQLLTLKQKENEITDIINKDQNTNASMRSKVESLNGILENKRKFWRMAIGEY